MVTVVFNTQNLMLALHTTTLFKYKTYNGHTEHPQQQVDSASTDYLEWASARRSLLSGSSSVAATDCKKEMAAEMSSMTAPTIAIRITGILKHCFSGNAWRTECLCSHKPVTEPAQECWNYCCLTSQCAWSSWIILQSNATENIASDEIYNISKKMLTVNLNNLIGLQHKHDKLLDIACLCYLGEQKLIKAK